MAGASIAGGEADGFVFAHGAGKVRKAVVSVGGLRALPIADPSDEVLACAREYWPIAFFTEIEGGTTPAVEETATDFANPPVVFTSVNAFEDAVYAKTKALYESKEAMAKTSPPFNAFAPDDIGKNDHGVTAFHPGAIRFFKERGLM